MMHLLQSYNRASILILTRVRRMRNGKNWREQRNKDDWSEKWNRQSADPDLIQVQQLYSDNQKTLK